VISMFEMTGRGSESASGATGCRSGIPLSTAAREMQELAAIRATFLSRSRFAM
jgi:hypothetical protein